MTKRVFFLGAGFSKAISSRFPLMNELTRDITQFFEKQSVSDHYNKEVTPILKENVEQLLTFLSTDLPWKTDVQKNADRALYYEITKQIQENLSSLCDDIWGNEQKSQTIDAFFDSIIANAANNSFITLNYDVLLEKLIYSAIYRKTNKTDMEIPLSKLYNYPMSWIGTRDNDGYARYAPDIYEYELPKILKLHGSINWYWAGENPSNIIYYKKVSEIYCDEQMQDLTSAGLKPYIIPPVTDKSAFYNHIMLKQLWKKAKAIIKDADEIYIVGFSMPMSDLSVKFLFQSALESNSTQKVFVVNVAKEKELISNYKGISLCDIEYKYTGNINVVETMCNDLVKV